MASTNELHNLSVLEWLDAAEDQSASAFAKLVDDEATLEAMATAWRQGFDSVNSMPAVMRPYVAMPQVLPRGRGFTPGSLGKDYPSELARQLQTAWSMAAGALSVTEAAVPFNLGESAESAALSCALAQAAPPALAPTPTEVVAEDETFRLRRALPGQGEGEPILLVAPFINRWYVLDLLENHSFIAMLTSLGRPVYVLEWRPPGDVTDERTLGDLCAGPLLGSLQHVLREHEIERAAVIGYCQGGTMAAMLAARYPEQVSRVATLAGPVKFSGNGLFRRWFDRRFMNVHAVAAGAKSIPAWLVHLPFWWLHPTARTLKLTHLCRSFRKPGAIEGFLAKEVWDHDCMDMSLGVFKSWIGNLYQEDALAEGVFEVDGQPVDLKRITQPLLVISGEYDGITTPASAEALTKLANAGWCKTFRAEASHVSLVSSPRVLGSERDALMEWLAAGAAAGTEKDMSSLATLAPECRGGIGKGNGKSNGNGGINF